MIHSILDYLGNIDVEVNAWCNNNKDKYIILKTTVNTVSNEKFLAVIEYEEPEKGCMFEDEEECNGDCDNCALNDSEEIEIGDN
jgi:hypothetical protein